MCEPLAAHMGIEPQAVIALGALLGLAELLDRAASVNDVARATVSGAGAGPEKGGGGEATSLADRAGNGGASQRRRRRRVDPLDGQRRGGRGERRQ